MLDLQLVHDTSEGLLEFVYLLIELFPYLMFKLRVKVFVDANGLIRFFNFCKHFIDHPLHFLDLW